MSKELIISSTIHETRVATLENDQLVEISIERESEHALAGNIYKGRVSRVLPGMQSAFVKIGLERDGFLYVSDVLDQTEELESGLLDDEEDAVVASEPVVGGGRSPEPGAAEEDDPGRRRRGGRGRRGRRRHGSDDGERERRSQEPAADGDESHRRGRSDRPGDDDERRSREPGAEGDGTHRRGRPDRPEEEGERRNEESDGDGPRRRGRRRRGRGNSEEPARRSEEQAAPRASSVSVLPGESLAKYRGAPAAEDRFEEPEPEEIEENGFEAAEANGRDEDGAEEGVKVDIRDNDAVDDGVADDDVADDDVADDGVADDDVADDDVADDGVADDDVADDDVADDDVADDGVADDDDDVVEEADFVDEVDDDEDSDETDETADEERDDEHEEDLDESDAAAGAEESDESEPEGEADDEYSDEEEADDEETDEDGGDSEEPSAAADDADDADRSDERDGSEDDNERRGPAEAEVRDHSESRSLRRGRRGRRRGGRGRRGPNEDGAGEQTVAAEPEPKRRDGRRPEGSSKPEASSSEAPLISDLLKAGQEVIVQVAKEPLGRKGARITSHIALPGRYLVYMPTVKHVGVSRKIHSDGERARLRRVIRDNMGGAPGGCIVRTAGQGASDEDLIADMQFLINIWKGVLEKAEKRQAPTLLHQDLDIVERILRDQLGQNFKTIWVDEEQQYERMLQFVERFQPDLVGRVKLYTRSKPLFDAFGISNEIEKALRPKVWLKSGGYIVINQTEALVSIDINTGKYVGKSDRLEDTIVKTNLDAVQEIVRQMRLRDLGGIIVVDFIDMDDRQNRNKVMQALEQELRRDRAPSKALPFNDFGLVAITRKRVKRSIERTLCSPCPSCAGSGYVKSVPTMIFELFEEARKLAGERQAQKDVTLRVHPDVARAFKSRDNSYLQEIEDIFRSNVIVRGDLSLHRENFDINC